MVEDVKLWAEVKARITTKISYNDFVTMCTLHAKYYNHKNDLMCGRCDKEKLRLWISEIDSKLIK
jgi:hypothetical protein